MTDEEKKAIELIEKFDTMPDKVVLFLTKDEIFESIKKASLNCVDEIISACEYNMVEFHNTDWWNFIILIGGIE
jgi:hypothetical protein